MATQSSNTQGNPNKAVTLQDIAERCGVTKITVSRALRNDTRNVSREMIERIKVMARQMGYDHTRQHAARQLAARKHGQAIINHVIALFFPEDFGETPYSMQLFRGVLDASLSQNFGLLSNYLRPPHLMEILPIFGRGDVDGVILLSPVVHAARIVERLRNEAGFGNRPVISMLQPLEGLSSVMPDDRLGGYQAARHLLELGHRHLMHSCWPHYGHQQRLLGYQDACHEFHLHPRAHLYLHEWLNEDDYQSACDLLAFLKAHPQITGILAPNDRVAILMANALREAGMRIPEDISLVGYDDILPLENDRKENILTTVRVPLYQLGQETAKLVIRRITGESASDEDIVLRTEFIPRKTTAGPKV